MLRLLMLMLSLLTLISCSFRNKPTKESKEMISETSPLSTNDPNADSDGDFIKDSEEKPRGTNPLIANLPDVRIRFLQNYKIVVKYKNIKDGMLGEFSIDTKTHQDDPDFKYRVGDIFIRNESFKNAGSVGKFSTHSWGEINEHDLSWISYPEVDPRFFSQKQLEYKKFLNSEEYQIEGVSVVLENSAKLKGNDGFTSIKSLALNFYYYDYEKESYELLKTELVDRHFYPDVNETFEVTLENVPLNLLAENYFKRGEFIISELSNFEIPDLTTDYQRLLKSVRAKSIPVIYNTPLESSLFYVGLNGKEGSFAKILGTLFSGMVEIEDNTLLKIGQFSNNLPTFSHLMEVKAEDKKGKWFAFTNRLTQHYLDHHYSPRDIISLSYLTGVMLASQDAEKIVSLRESAISENGAKIYPLGNVSPNSQIDIQLKPIKTWGESKKNFSTSVSSAGGSCGKNCFSREYTCWHDINLFLPLDEALVFKKDFTEELDRITLLINQDEFDLKELVDSKKVKAEWIDSSLHLTITNVNGIKPLLEVDENLMAIKLTEFKETTFNGVRLTNFTGRDWPTCIPITINGAGQQGWPISVESKDFPNWAGTVRWDRVKRGDPKTYTRNFSVGISSIVNNYYN